VAPPDLLAHPPGRWIATALAVWSTRRDTVIRLMRYAAVSVVSTTTSLVTLGVLVGMVGGAATWSNVVATAVGTVPSFELNRRWVWSNDGRRSLFNQVVPFVALSFAGLVISTVAVGVVAGRTAGWGHWSRTVAVLAANVAAYGALWVVQYQLLDRFLFRSDAAPAARVAVSEVPVGRQTAPRWPGRGGSMLTEGAHRPSVVTYGREDHG
jgi:putative flippase GtrA